MDVKELKALFWAFVGPWHFMSMALSYLPGTIRQHLAAGKLGLSSWPQIQHAWFTSFWMWMGGEIRKGNGPRITALLEGRVTKGDVVDEPAVAPVGGVVLDIGPGLGFWVDLYAEANVPVEGNGAKYRGRGNGINKIYGVEPNVEAHADLTMRVRKAGLESVYEILPVGIESLSQPRADGTAKIEKESVDCIVTLLCLCSIPEPEKNIHELYGYLKKGGRWYLYEHVRVKRSVVMRWYQVVVNIFWPRVLDGCQLCRDTESTLRNTGPWAKIDLAQPVIEPWHQVVPHVFGTLTK